MKWNDQRNFHQKKSHAFSFSPLKKISGAWLNILKSNTTTEESRNATHVYILTVNINAFSLATFWTY